MSHRALFLFAFIMSTMTSSASAVTMRLEFDASDFYDGVGSTEPPTNHVHGVFTYRLRADGYTIDSVSSVSLTIDTHTYSVAEVGSLSHGHETFDLIGGLAGTFMNTDPNVVGIGENDFWVMFERSPPFGSLLSMIYATSTSGGIYVARASSYEITELSEVPLPPALPLFATALGVMGLLGWSRKRKRAATAG